MVRYSQLLAGASALLGAASGEVIKRQQGSLPPVSVNGNAFYTEDGDRFYIRGVAYQPGGAADAQDPLLDKAALTRDIKNFKELGINTIRIYTIDNSKNHDEAMQMLDAAGIYLALDANTPNYSLNRESLDSLHASYNDVYLQSIFATIDAFSGYNNLLLFYSGNEVINAKNNTNAAPYIKAVTRDMRQYISAQADRAIPVGYSSADVAENIQQQAQYFACGDDDWARSDFFAFNDYSWCSPSTLQKSGWEAKVEQYSGYPLPMFLSEYGCITNQRQWDEVEALYSEAVTPVWSGGLAYEYTTGENDYGLVEATGSGVEPNQDFERLAQAFANTPAPTGDGGAKTDVTYPDCPPADDQWEVDTLKLPVIPAKAQKYMKNGAGTGPGLATNGEGSQWAGTPSTTSADLSDGEAVSENAAGTGSASSNGNSGSSSSSSSNSDEEDTAESAAGSVSGASAAFAAVALTALLAFVA